MSKIPVGETGYDSEGRAYEIAFHHPDGGYIVYPLIWEYETHAEYPDEHTPTYFKFLYTSPDSQVINLKITEKEKELEDLRKTETVLRKSLSDLQSEINKADKLKSELRNEFPFLETILKIKKKELNYFVRRNSFATYTVNQIRTTWNDSVSKLCIAAFYMDRDKFTFYMDNEAHFEFFATLEEAKEFAKEKVLEDLRSYESSDSLNDFEYYVHMCKEAGYDIPKDILTSHLEKRIEKIVARRKYLKEDLIKEDKTLAELKEKLKELEER